MRFSTAVLAGLCLVYFASGVGAGEAPVSPEQIATWVKQLGSDDFDAREKAEVALAKAGLAAMTELQKAAQSNDPEIRTRSARLLETLKWATLPKITDLASALSQDNMLYIGTPGLKDAITRIRKETALGRLYDHADLLPLRETLWATGLQDAGLDDDSRKVVDQWLDRFGGPYGLAFMKEDRTKEWPEREQVAFFLGLNGTDPKADMEMFQKLFPLKGEKATAQVYRGVSCNFLEEDWRKDGLALVKNLIVRSNGKASMFNVIDAVMDDKRTDLAGSAVYKEARSKIAGEPLATLFFNMQSMFGTVFSSDRDKAAATGLGFQEWKYAIVTLGLQDGLFLEQALCKVDGERRGLAKLLSLTPVSGRLAALCPPDALVFVSVPADGMAIYQAIMSIAESVDPRDAKQFRDQLEVLDQQLNVKVMDTLAGALKGEAALWLLRPQGPDLTAMPQTCLVLEAVDAAAATKAADTLAKLLPLIAAKEDFVGKADYQGRTCYFMKQKEKSNRWEPDLKWSWCADGARVLIGQKQEVLQQMLLRSTQAAKGLDTRPDFQKLLAATPQEQRGGLAYANAGEVLTWAYTVGLPALGADAPEEVKAKLAKMPKDPQALFKDFPGTLLSVRGTPEGVCARAVGGLPATAWTMTVPFAFFYGMRVAMQEEMVKQQAEAAAAAQKEAEENAVEDEKAEAKKAQPAEKKAEAKKPAK